MGQRLGVVLFNLGGPDTLDAVEPFLKNLFSDPAIIRAPGFVRLPLAWFIARRRRDYARSIYASIGGGSPIVRETQAQADALEVLLKADGIEARVVIAMRYWKPRASEAAQVLKAWGAERIALVPLYPQFSTTTTASSVADWAQAAASVGLSGPAAGACCYPLNEGFIAAYADLLRQGLAQVPAGRVPHILFSAHGLPEKIVLAGDPYAMQVEASARAIAEAAGVTAVDSRVTYQSRVGPLKWIGPDTDEEVKAAGKAGLVPVVVPLSFVSEHSETLYELDQIYRAAALAAGAPAYIRVPAIGTHPRFIGALADVVRGSLGRSGLAPDSAWTGCGGARGCPCTGREAA
ncbi:MAG: ferrochelatase [Alphaproteobacteria bacterium]|nr:ferrochelatase [Alphaproteobacteria bacterium]